MGIAPVGTLVHCYQQEASICQAGEHVDCTVEATPRRWPKSACAKTHGGVRRGRLTAGETWSNLRRPKNRGEFFEKNSPTKSPSAPNTYNIKMNSARDVLQRIATPDVHRHQHRYKVACAVKCTHYV